MDATEFKRWRMVSYNIFSGELFHMNGLSTCFIFIQILLQGKGLWMGVHFLWVLRCVVNFVLWKPKFHIACSLFHVINKWPYSCLNKFCAIDCRASTDFVCFRGLLTMLMCTPYEMNDDWIICATKWKGIIFLCARETEKKRLYKAQLSERDRQFTSWGYKFEQYMSSGTILRGWELHFDVSLMEEISCIIPWNYKSTTQIGGIVHYQRGQTTDSLFNLIITHSVST
jgi:hypothetical protein